MPSSAFTVNIGMRITIFSRDKKLKAKKIKLAKSDKACRLKVICKKSEIENLS